MSTRHLVWSCVVIGWLWAAAPAGAHRLDEYLQATRIGVSQGRIDLEIDKQKSMRYLFMMHRVPGTPSVVFGRKK